MINEPTNMEILEALNIFSSKMDKRINDLEDNLEKKIDDLRFELSQRLDDHEVWLKSLEKNMVNKNEFNGLVNSFNGLANSFNSLANCFNGLTNCLKDKELISNRETAKFLYPKIVN